ncbi:hypothetical protein VW29_16680 [Devosia limi DSM 17137]|uniref:Chromosome partitioning ATPase, Mrp family, contains Fe-S cluster n=1 Tax=Devosia limi DSM 17137 TaxID=1121477 RepID=A0A0F5LEM3_9HYPH|nr:hypothetical protein [Devosia limi]KKB80644.1 hypothetical protein VW29_16680 [Devosia limi DSM 17137]SHE49814.1 Chromosome partitioning ATPase, Mrp family, contains Fe-S cluster [Devosia limi DSM 17137]
MDSFINALTRAQDAARPAPQVVHPLSARPHLNLVQEPRMLVPTALKSNRIVSYDGTDKMTRAFDVLRNTCLKEADPDATESAIIAVTAPTVHCGTSTTAANLAFSIARMRKGEVVLVDLAPSGSGLRSLLGLDLRNSPAPQPSDAFQKLEVGGVTVRLTSLLPAIEGKAGAELRNAFMEWANTVRRDLGPVTIILDLPPLLSDDRAVSLVSEIDIVLLLLAVGESTMADLDNCRSYLHGARSVQLVLNKARSYDL